jgi:cathepsin L
MHIEEVRQMLNGVSSARLLAAHKQSLLHAPNNVFKPMIDLKVPDHKDWREEGAVTAPKDQGQCGSCWSFSTTGAVEGCHAIRYKKLVGLSEQNLMDCSFDYGNEGCNGGLMTQAMDYIIKNNGIDTEESYPYTAKDGTTCKYDAAKSAATLSGYKNIRRGNEEDLVQALTVGPVSVAIDASLKSFTFYSGGGMIPVHCKNHQALTSCLYSLQ